jgi:hypothetical protein
MRDAAPIQPNSSPEVRLNESDLPIGGRGERLASAAATMVRDERESDRPFRRRLHETMAQRLPPDVPDAGETFFRRKPALEAEAKAAGAFVGTLSAIANARFTAGVATLKPWFPMPRGH